MSLDYATLDTLRSHHPAWRLLRSDHAPLVASFLHRVFVVPNVRVMAAADLAEALEDALYALRLHLGETEFPKSAREYLNDWAAPDKGWLRKFYRSGTDEAQFDLTPATEKAIAWLAQLSERQFVGTESRLLTLFDLLKQMSEGSEADPAKRIAELLNPNLKVEGLLRTMYDPRLSLMNDVSAQLKEHFGEQLYDTVIPRNIRLAEAPSYGMPALAYDKQSRGALAYLALAGEMVRRQRKNSRIAAAQAT